MWSICCCSRHTRIGPSTIQDEPVKLHEDGTADEGETLGLEVCALELPHTMRGQVSATDLYNALGNSTRTTYHIHDPLYLLLVDTRPMADYTAHHILSAFHVTALRAGVINQKLGQFHRVVLYGSTSDPTEDGDGHTEEALAVLERRQIDFQVLVGGYGEFHRRFPWSCDAVTVWAQTEREVRLRPYPSLVLEDWLFQGSADQAKNADIIGGAGFTHVVNISTEKTTPISDVSYLNVKLEDEGKSRIGERLDEMAEFIEAARAAGGKVLVHCNLGISRSSSATLAYLMKYWRVSLLDALRLLRRRRPVSSPNRGFLTQLADYEYYLFGQRITDPHQLWLAI